MSDILLLICCILSGFCVGLFLQRRKTEQVLFLRDLTNYLSLLRANVSSKRIPLPGFNEQFSAQCSKGFAEYLSGSKTLPFPKNDATQINAFFDGLSCTNSDELLKHIDYYEKIFARLSSVYFDQADKQKGRYVKLGVLLGAMVGVLFL